MIPMVYAEQEMERNSVFAKQASRERIIERLLPWLILGACFGYLCLFCRYSTLEPDEGIVLQGAERILNGQIPYRDFFSFYTPGAFYLIAGLFKLFADSFLIARTSVAVAGAACSTVTYVLARRVCPRGVALLAAVLATTCGAAFRFLVLHNVYSTLGCCLSVYAAIRWLETRRCGWIFLAGALASLTFLTEQSKGGGLMVGLAFGVALLGILDHGNDRIKLALTVAAAGFLVPVIGTLCYFAAHGITGLMLQSWIWPIRHYTTANHVPYGYQNWSDHTRDAIFRTGPMPVRITKTVAILPGLLVPILPLVGVGILIYWIIQSKRDGASVPNQSGYYILICSVSTGLFLSVLMARADIIHLMYLTPLWYLILAWAVGARGIRSSSLISSRVPLIALVVISFGLLSMALLSSAVGARERIQTRRGAVFVGRSDTVIAYVQAHIVPSGDLVVYPYLPLYNYLTHTNNPTAYDFFQPGMNTSAQAEEIVRSLQKSQPPVLFEPQFPEKIANSWPQTPLSVFAQDPVSDFIARNYRVCQSLFSPEGWHFQFMVRKESICR
jgi:4-amino-4-deoxy-L-arabinose transferase-like glycosyltransferase